MKALIKPSITLTLPPDEQIIRVTRETIQHYQETVHRCVMCGAMLLAKREGMANHRGGFVAWLGKNLEDVSRGTLYRWMGAAENGLRMFLKQHDLLASPSPEGPIIEIGSERVTFLSLLAPPSDDSTTAGNAGRQLWLDFTQHKTLRELGGVAVDGDAAHRITRAGNGARMGGTRGEDRKDWPKFIAWKLSDISSHLGRKMSPAQRTATGAAFDAALQKWPRWIIDLLTEYVKRENKLSDEQRAARQ